MNMANIAIFRINYKSDFILTLNSDAGWMTPFCIKFWTGAPSQAYFVGFDGTTYTHCAPVDGEPTKLRVQFDDHHLPIGDLKFQIGYHFTVDDFPTSVEDEVLNQASVIIEADDAPAQVMLDLNGETAPEIEFSLPAYANEAQRIANEQARIAAEQQRIANEDARIQAEETRQYNEQQRIQHEEARVTEFDRLKRESEAATGAANDAATLANEKAQLAADKAALAQAAATLANEKAQLAADKAALAQDAADLANAKAALAQQKAEYAKAQGDYAKEQGIIAEEDHVRAEADHERAESDHATLENVPDSVPSTSPTDLSGNVEDVYLKNRSNNNPQAPRTLARLVTDSAKNRPLNESLTRLAEYQSLGFPAFSTSVSYAEGDPCFHDRRLYKAKAGGHSAGTWNAAHFEEFSVKEYTDAHVGIFDVSANNGGAVFASLQALLSDANLNTLIPAPFKRGGITITFIQGTAQSSDNKYVQCRLLADEWSINTDKWAIADEGVYVENPEFIYVKTDKDDKILWAIKIDGGIYYGAGVPSQVIEYIEEKIADLSLDEYEDIVTFLSDYLGSDTTLKVMIEGINAQITTKVDKVEGKSLIDSEFADVQSHTDNPEWLQVKTDFEDKLLEGIQKDGTKVIGGDIRVLGNMELSGVSYKVIENPEYLAAWVDAEDKVIFGFKTDGKTYVGDADFLNDIDNIKDFLQDITDKNIDWDALTSITATENPEYIEAKTDSEGKLLAGRTPDGAAFENVGLSTPKVSINGHIVENIEDPEGRTEILTDSEAKIISYRDSNGVLHENAGIETSSIKSNNLNLSESNANEIKTALENIGFTVKTPIDWSDKSYIHLPEKPKCAVINISGIDSMPTTKTDDLRAYIEVWDKLGNYFKKKCILNAQGRSSMQQYKQNFAADFCEDEWEGDTTTDIKIGDWVSQDSFHFKAYYTDMFKAANVMSYSIYNAMMNTFDTANRPYKEYFASGYTPTTGDKSDFNQNANVEARCVPDGFPVMVYLNGEFYGLFSWQLKKHRDNYFMDRNATDNIHIDGEAYLKMFDGNVLWPSCEIRNPKPKKSKWTLYCMDGSKYDGDAPKELIDSTSEYWDATNASHQKSAEVKGHILSLSQYMTEIAPYEEAYNNASFEDKPNALATLKTEIEKRFWVKWMIEYILLINIIQDGDSVDNNAQWMTWGDKNSDGKLKWCPCLYDADSAFGINSTTSFTFSSPIATSYGLSSTTPLRYVYNYYLEELKDRYSDLRNRGIFSYDKFIGMFMDWINAIGFSNYELEYDKWDESPCNRSSQINSEWSYNNYFYNSFGYPWNSNRTFSSGAYVRHYNRCFESLVNNNTGHEPVAKTTTAYWKDVTWDDAHTYELNGETVLGYTQGSVIFDGYENFARFIALENTNKRPLKKIYEHYPHEGGVFDSIYRISAWIKEKIRLTDIQMNYNN